MLTWAFDPCDLPVGTAEPGPWDEQAPILGPYVLIEEIGRGGMGVIYRAVHRGACEEVALKTVLPQYTSNSEILARFQREAKTAQSFEHPHAMPILEVGCSETGVPFFTMPVAAGGSLQRLGAKYRGRWRRIAELVAKVARAVHHAHQRGVLHRDIKPGNILFTEDHEPIVADFGLAKAIVDPDDLTRSYAVLGTPNYVAPEQAAGQTLELTPAVDIYSLGAVLYELLTGRPPFAGDNPLDVLRQVSTEFPVLPRSLAPAVPRVLEQICLCCLERAPSDRYSSAQALANDLEHWVDGRPVTPRPVRLRVRGFFRYHPRIRVLGSFAAVLVALLSTWKVAGYFAVSQPPISMAMVVDELEPSTASRQLTKRLADQLKQDISSGHAFRLQGSNESTPRAATLDPLTFARTFSAQVVLTNHLRQSGTQMHLMSRLVRCDTGETIWKQRSVFALDQLAIDLPSVAKGLIDHLKQSWDERFQGKERVDSQPPAQAQDFYTHAMELAGHGTRRDMEAAIELLQRARKVDPHFVQAGAMLAFSQWILGYGYGASDQLALAEKTARDTLALDPDSAPAHRVVASCYQQQGRYDEARQEFELAVELAPESAGCCQSLGICLKQMGYPDQAIPWLRRAAEIEPAHGNFQASLGEALILCGLDQQAEAAFARAAEIDTERPDAQFAMVALCVWQKRYEAARSLCATAGRRFPDYNFKLNFAAWTDFCDGQLSEAQGYYEAMRAENLYESQWIFHGAINPVSALAYIALRSGLIEQAGALTGEALHIDQDLLTKYPGNNRILHDIAATYAVRGDEQNALRYLERSLAAGWAEHRSTRVDPRFSLLARSPSFTTLMEKTMPKYQGTETW